MDNSEAALVVRSLLGRLRTNMDCYELPGGLLSAVEADALRLLSGADQIHPSSAQLPAAISSQEQVAEINVECLFDEPDVSATLCIDFGTAYSKAAIWRESSALPIPLDLEKGADPARTGVLLDSAVYISEGCIFFGRAALDQFRHEDSLDRALFSSPKELLTHDAQRLEVERPGKDVDPTGLFSSRALLTLYLGYLTAVACEVLPVGVKRTVRRRYAAPGWNNAQADMKSEDMGAAARSLGELLVDAQILADSVDITEWRSGLAVQKAKSLGDAIRKYRAENKAVKSPFIERAVLEAVAAATGIRDRFVNQRPQVLVVDVGAGTTDIGCFKFVNRADGEGVCAPYRGGMRAVQIAGNMLDDALIGLSLSRLAIPADGDAARRFKRRVKATIREAKAKLCETGEIEIDVPDFPVTKIELPQFVSTPIVTDYVAKFEKAVIDALNGSGASFRSFADDSIAVFTGGGGSLPFLRGVLDKKAVNLNAGPAYFLIDDALPEWVSRTTPDVSQLFPQVAVSTGGCSSFLPEEAHAVTDTSAAAPRSLAATYRS